MVGNALLVRNIHSVGHGSGVHLLNAHRVGHGNGHGNGLNNRVRDGVRYGNRLHTLNGVRRVVSHSDSLNHFEWDGHVDRYSLDNLIGPGKATSISWIFSMVTGTT